MSQAQINNFLKVWADSQSSPSDPKSLKGLHNTLRSLLEDPQNKELRSLALSSAEHLFQAFQAGIAQTEQESEQVPDHSPLLEMYDNTLTSYALVLNLTEHISTEPSSLESNELEATITDLEEAISEMELDQEQWSEFLESTEPQCAKCGFAEEGHIVCPECQVDLLIPDRRESRSNGSRAVLGPEYVQAYQAYLDLQDGKISLRGLFQALNPLDGSVRQWGMLVKNGNLQGLPEELSQYLSSAVEQSQSGLMQVYNSEDTRQWSDINDGWDNIYQAAITLQKVLPALHRALGDEDGARALEDSYRLRDIA